MFLQVLQVQVNQVNQWKCRSFLLRIGNVAGHWPIGSEEKRCRALWNVMIAPLLMQLGVEIASLKLE